MGIVDVVVAGHHENLNAVSLQLRQIVGHLKVTAQFAVFGQITGYDQKVGMLRLDSFHSSLQYGFTFAQHFAVLHQVGFKGRSARSQPGIIEMRI